MERVEVVRGEGVSVIGEGSGMKLPVCYYKGEYYIREAEARNIIYGFNPKVIKNVDKEGVILVDETVTEMGRSVVRYVRADDYVKKLEKQIKRKGKRGSRNREREELREMIMKELYNTVEEKGEEKEYKEITGYEVKERKSEIGELMMIESEGEEYLIEDDIGEMIFGDRYSKDKFNEIRRAYRIEVDARIREEGKEYRLYKVNTIGKLLSEIIGKSEKKSLRNISSYIYRWISNEMRD